MTRLTPVASYKSPTLLAAIRTGPERAQAYFPLAQSARERTAGLPIEFARQANIRLGLVKADPLVC